MTDVKEEPSDKSGDGWCRSWSYSQELDRNSSSVLSEDMSLTSHWIVPECPLKADCSTLSWKNAYCSSQTSEAHCRKLLYKNLTRSSNRNCKFKHELHEVAVSADIVETQEEEWENEDERMKDGNLEIPVPSAEEYDKQAAAQDEEAVEPEDDEGQKVWGGKGKGKYVTTEAQLTSILAATADGAAQASGASSAVSRQLLHLPPSSVTTLADPRSTGGTPSLQLLHQAVDSAKRIKRSIEHALSFFRNGVTAFEAESQVER